MNDFDDGLTTKQFLASLGIDTKPLKTKNRGNRGPMASLAKIATYWCESSTEVFPNLVSRAIGWGEPFCFRCGWLAPIPNEDVPDPWTKATGWLERAHLHDHVLGGPGTPENLVPLCGLCHHVMPQGFADRDAAIAWINSANPHTLTPGWQQATDGWFGGDNFRSYPGYRSLAAAKVQFMEHVRIKMAEWRVEEAARLAAEALAAQAA